jgi:uncharacterized RDD family membrane protein YckC
VAVIALAMVGGGLQIQSITPLIMALLIGLFYAFLLGFDIYFGVRHNGQTPGKRIAGLRALREGGAPLDFRSACIRSLLALVDFLPCFYFLGGFLVLVTSRGQRLGDLAAGTIVIRERSLDAPADLEAETKHLITDEYVFTPEQLATCVPADRHILRSFFQRYKEMQAEPRLSLARHLADTFIRKTAYQPASGTRGLYPEAFLATLYHSLENLARNSR